jgi:hypothetical protein
MAALIPTATRLIIGVAAKQAIKQGTKQAAKQGAKQAAKQGTKQAAKQGTKQAAKKQTARSARGAGPSGKPKIHNQHFPSKKAAKDAARRDGAGKPVHDIPKAGSGQRRHYHAVDKNGQRKSTGKHYTYGPKK